MLCIGGRTDTYSGSISAWTLSLQRATCNKVSTGTHKCEYYQSDSLKTDPCNSYSQPDASPVRTQRIIVQQHIHTLAAGTTQQQAADLNLPNRLKSPPHPTSKSLCEGFLINSTCLGQVWADAGLSLCTLCSATTALAGLTEALSIGDCILYSICDSSGHQSTQRNACYALLW